MRRCFFYFKCYLLLRVLYINYSKKCRSFEFMIGDKSCNFAAPYRSPSQSQDDLEISVNLKIMLENLKQKGFFPTTIAADCNTKSLCFEVSFIESIICHVD